MKRPFFGDLSDAPCDQYDTDDVIGDPGNPGGAHGDPGNAGDLSNHYEEVWW